MDSCHKWCGPILGIIIIVFAFNPDLIPAISGKWVVIIAAVLSILNCWQCHRTCVTPKKKK